MLIFVNFGHDCLIKFITNAIKHEQQRTFMRKKNYSNYKDKGLSGSPTNFLQIFKMNLKGPEITSALGNNFVTHT